MAPVGSRKRQSCTVRPRERWLAGLVLLGAAGVFAVLAARHPGGLIPACPTAAHMGFYCPGCGSLRASHHLLNARFEEGWRHNPLLIVVGVPLGIWFAATLFVMAAFGRRLSAPIRGAGWAWAALGVILAYTVVRNLPGDRFDRLRPPEPRQSDPA